MILRASRLSFLASFATLLCTGCGSSVPDEAASSVSQSTSLISAAASAPSLGTAGTFALLAGTAVTCTNATVAGNVGVSPGSTITHTSCPVTGTINAGDTVAAQAHNDFITAYAAFAALPCGQTLTTLDSQTLSPGIYCFDAAVTSTGGVLTLDGPADGIWIFKVGTLGTGALTGTGFSVVVPGGLAPACNSVYWWVAEAATMTDSKFVGTILAGAAVTLTRGTFTGDAFAKAAVTITGTTAMACALGGGGSPPPVLCERKDFVTGGGWIGDGSKARSTFGVAGGIKHGALWGHLTYEDHSRNGLDVKSSEVTAYSALDATTRRIEGTAKVNGRSGYTYQVDVSDKGEPGRNDTFSIRVSNGYRASGSLAGGNIQLHRGSNGVCDEKGGGKNDDDEDNEYDRHHE